MALTDTTIRKAKPTTKRYKLHDSRGLFMIVAPGGGKWWRLKYQWNAREKTVSLGVYPEVSLALARDKREELRSMIRKGIDPSAQRDAEKQATADTFEVIAREWLDTQKDSLKPNTLRIARRRFEMWVFPYIARDPIGEIEPPEILRLLRRLEAKGSVDTAHRVRGRISQVFRYAIATGRCDRDPTADLRGALKPIVSNGRSALTEPKQVGELLRAIEGYHGHPTTRAALQLLALTFVRPGELRLAQWPEFDLENQLWRVPASRMKMGKEHLVPLSKQAVDVLRGILPITGHQALVFQSLRPGRPLSGNTFNTALRTLGYAREVMSAHGFRAMASTLLHEQGWTPEVIELQLAHAQRNQVAAAYNRSARLEERKHMMQAWSDYLDALAQGAPVVSIRRKGE